MQFWRDEQPIEILENCLPGRRRTAEAFLLCDKHLHSQMALKCLKSDKLSCQPRTNWETAVLFDFGLVPQIDIFYSLLTHIGTPTSMALEQLYNQAMPANDSFAPGVVFSLFFANEHIELKSASYGGFFGWLRRLLAGKEQKQPRESGGRRPEQRKLPTRREGGREPLESREPDAWE